MALRRKPHSLAVYGVSDDADNHGVAVNPLDEDAETIRCQVTPMSVQVAFEQYGVEAKRPHLVLCDPGAVTVKIGQKVVWNTKVYRTVKESETFTGFGGADNTAFVIDYSEGENN